MWRKSVSRLACLHTAVVCLSAYADNSNFGKIYDPYVQLLEKEVEYRSLYKDDSDPAVDNASLHQLGYGQSLSDRMFIEFYLAGLSDSSGNMEIEFYELEMKLQLSEQGERDNDWGVSFGLEKEHDVDVWEASSTLILLHEWPSWIATINFSLIYEWGNDIDNEWETALASQMRYRHSELLEPGVEFYQSQYVQGAGPFIGGLFRLGNGRKLYWHTGLILGTNDDTSDINLKFDLAYEFQ